MLFKRQQLLLTLLEALGASASHMDFQKWLFLYTQEYETAPSYEFVPYRFGGFSFTSYADKRKLIALGLLAEDDQNWRLTTAGVAAARRHSGVSRPAALFARRYAGLHGNALILEQYRRFPYYAVRSEILDDLPLDKETRERIAASRPKRQMEGLLTIGYEGRNLENYLNTLLRESVTVLCDVRRNPLSRKYGFSKGTLSKACVGVGIRYEHLPELGIPSECRKNLVSQGDYDALFDTYERETLAQQRESLNRIESWIAAGHRVALTCYEALPGQCHRSRVARVLQGNGRHL